MQTFLRTLLQRLGLQRNRPAIEDELLATVRPPAPDTLSALAPAPARTARRKVRIAKQRTLADILRENAERLGESLIAGGARMDAIYNSISRLGGSSDKGAAALPDTSRVPLELTHLDILYRYSAYGRRVVDIVPDEETRRGWRIVDGTQRVDALAEEEKRLHLASRINMARKWARHAGGSLILLVVDEDPAPGVRPADQLRQPLDLTRVRRLRNLLVIDRTEATPHTWDGEVQSTGFGEPLTWSLSPGTSAMLTSGGRPTGGGAIVHRSRILTFSGRRLTRRLRQQNGGWDDSVLESCWDAIRHLTSVDQGAALIAQEWQIKVLKIKGLAGVQAGDQAVAFYTRLQQMATSMSMLNMSVLDQDEDLTSLATSTTGFEELSTHARTELATAADMPQVLLFGEAPSGLNTDGDSWRRHHAQSIAASQETEIRDPLERIYRVLYAQTEGPTHGQAPARWDLVFEPLEQLTEAERADIRLVVAQTDAAYVQAGVLPAEHVAKSRFGKDGWSDDILPYDPAAEEDPAEVSAAQAALDRARTLLDAPTGGPGRTDADEWPAAWVALPVPDATRPLLAQLRALAEVVTGPLEQRGEPHVTLLYVGSLAVPLLPALIDAATEAVEEATPATLRPLAIRALGDGEPGEAVPVVVTVDGWELGRVNEALLRRCAHLISEPQHGRYIAHVTLGFAAALTASQRGRLGEIAVPQDVAWTAARVEVRHGAIVVETIPLEGRTDGAAD